MAESESSFVVRRRMAGGLTVCLVFVYLSVKGPCTNHVLEKMMFLDPHPPSCSFLRVRDRLCLTHNVPFWPTPTHPPPRHVICARPPSGGASVSRLRRGGINCKSSLAEYVGELCILFLRCFISRLYVYSCSLRECKLTTGCRMTRLWRRLQKHGSLTFLSWTTNLTVHIVCYLFCHVFDFPFRVSCAVLRLI